MDEVGDWLLVEGVSGIIDGNLVGFGGLTLDMTPKLCQKNLNLSFLNFE